MDKDEILKVFKDLNNNFGPEDEVLSIDVNGVKYNLSIEKLKSRYPEIKIEQVRKIFNKSDLELPEVKPSLKRNKGVKKSNTSMLIDLINLAHNKPVNNNRPNSSEENSTKLNNKKLKIGGGIFAASIVLFFVMLFIEKSSEKNFKFTETRRDTKNSNKKLENGFNRKRLQKATNRNFAPSTAKSALQERKIMRDSYKAPRQNTVRSIPNKRKPANKPEPLQIRPEEMIEPVPPEDNPYPEDNYDPYSAEDVDPYYEEDQPQPPPGDDPYLDNPYPD